MTHVISIALLHFLWQGALVGVLLWIVLWSLRDHSANLRYGLNCGALALLTLLPVITAYVLYQRGSGAERNVRVATAAVPLPAVPSAATPKADIRVARGLTDWALPVWAAGVLLFSLRMMWGFTEVASLRKRGQPACSEVTEKIKLLGARLGLTQKIGVLVYSLSTSPSVIGWLRPVILLPASAICGLSPEQLETVLAHELAHIRRHDYLVNILQMTVETLLFYHPAVWWVSGRIRHERELCCDDIAVSVCGDAVCYARALTALERMRQAVPAMALGSTDGALAYRIRRIVGDASFGRTASLRAGGPAVLLGLVCIAISVGMLRGQAMHSNAGILVHAPGVVHQTDIDYPASARAEGAEGLVEIQCTLDAQGNVVDAAIAPKWRSSQALKNAALAAVRKWRFSGGSRTIVMVLFQADPRTADSWLRAGDFLFRNGEIDESFRKYDEGAALHPERKIDFLKRQTEILISQGKTAEALAKDAEILREAPDDAEARGLRASFQLDKGDVDGAIKELRGVIDRAPDNFVAQFNLGRAYFEKGDVEQAQVQFNAALRIYPDFLPAKRALIQLELRKGEYGAFFNGHVLTAGQARTAIREILKKDPQNADALRMLAVLDGKEKK